MTAATSDTIRKVGKLIRVNRRIRVIDVSKEVQCSVGTVSGIIRHFGNKKVCAKWIPKELTQQQKNTRRDISATLLNRHRDVGGEDFFRGVVTGDESWVHH